MSLLQFLRILAIRRGIIFATLIACFVAATATAFLLPARYEAKNRVLIDTTKSDQFTTQLLQSQTLGSYIATQLKLVRDIQTAGLVVDRLGWVNDPTLQARFEAAGRPTGDIREWLAQSIIDSTEANFGESQSILEISYRGAEPVSTQRIAQAIREAFLEQDRTQRRNNAQRAASQFREQSRRAMAEVVRAEEARTQFARANGIILQGGLPDFSNPRLAALSSASSAPQAAAVAAGTSPARMQLDTIRQQIAQASQTLGPNHPTIQALNRQRAVLEQQAAREVSGVVGGPNRAQLEGAYQAEKARVLAQADQIDRLNQMNSDIAVKREQFQKLASRAEEMESQAQSQDSLLQPLGETNLPASPVWPNKPLVMGASLAVGLVLGILLALLVELIRRRVRSDEDLEYATSAPVLAIVGAAPSDEGLKSRVATVFGEKSVAPRRSLTEA
jgi:polysaccharide biosynthesis transport protein